MEHFKFFQNKKCEFFPCHKGTENFHNCLFCYCPIYLLDCDGNFLRLPNGMKDCSNCLIPHSKESWNKIINKLNETLFKKDIQKESNCDYNTIKKFIKIYNIEGLKNDKCNTFK